MELEHERDDALVDVDDRVLLGLLVALRRQSRDAVGTQSGIIIWKAKSSFFATPQQCYIGSTIFAVLLYSVQTVPIIIGWIKSETRSS